MTSNRALAEPPVKSCEVGLTVGVAARGSAEGLSGERRALIEYLEQQVPLAPELRGGALTDSLVRELLGQICADTSVREWLPTTCSRAPSGDALRALRRTLIRDAVDVPPRAAAAALGDLDPESRRELSWALAVLKALTLGADLRSLVASLELYLGINPACSNLPPTVLPGAGEQAADSVRLLVDVARLLSRVDEERAQLLEERETYAPQRVQRLLLDMGRIDGDATAPLDEARVAALGNLLTAVDRLQTASGRIESEGPSPDSLRSIALGYWAVLEHARVLLDGQPSSGGGSRTAQRLRVYTTALVMAADTGLGAAVMSALAQDADTLPVPPAVAEAVELGFRILRVRTQAELEALVRNRVLHLGPWADGVLFDINVGAARVAADDLRLAGDVGVGYASDFWGFLGRASLANYDLRSNARLSQTERAGGGVEAWMVSQPNVLRWEGRLSASMNLYNTDAFDLTGQADEVFADETSVASRAKALFSARYEPDASFGLGVWIGPGLQYENLNALTVTRSGSSVSIDDSSELSLTLEARLRMQLVVVPRWLVWRTRLDGQQLSIGRNESNLAVSQGAVANTARDVRANQLELSARSYLDFEVARIVGFVPTLGGGADYIAQSHPSQTLSTTVFVIHAGVRRVMY